MGHFEREEIKDLKFKLTKAEQEKQELLEKLNKVTDQRDFFQNLVKLYETD